MTETTMPNNAQDWADFLVEKTLPSPFRFGRLVLKHMEEQSLPYQRIATELSHDPILAFRIMHTSNAQRSNNKPLSKTLDHAISMLGVDHLKSIIEALPYQDASSEDIRSFYYVRTLSSSLYAAHLGQAIAKKKGAGAPNDIYWSSLFLGVPVWYLWRHATPEMRLIRYAIRDKHKLPAVAETEVLGCTMLELCTAVTNQLALPELVKECYQAERQPSRAQWLRIARLAKPEGVPDRIEDRDLAMLSQQPHFVVMLANMVAHYATHDWYSRACLRSQRILAGYLHVSHAEAIRFSHEVAATMSREHPMPGVMLPAAKLFLEPRDRTQKRVGETGKKAAPTPQPKPSKNKQIQAEPGKKTEHAKPEAELETAEMPGGLFKELTEIMSLRPGEFVDLHELMNAATQALAYGLNLKRATVSLVNRDGTRLKTYYSVGCREQSELSTFEARIIKDTIFAKLVERPASLWVRSSTSKRVTDMVPSNFKQVIEAEEYFLMSVFVSKKPVAIFYADNFNGDNARQTPMTERQYKYFKYLCGAVTNALIHQARQKRADA